MVNQMKLHVEYEQEVDGRWIAEIPELPGVMCYGTPRKDVAAKVEALALRATADRLDEGKMEVPPSLSRPWHVLRYEPIVGFEGAAGLDRASPGRLVRQIGGLAMIPIVLSRNNPSQPRVESRKLRSFATPKPNANWIE